MLDAKWLEALRLSARPSFIALVLGGGLLLLHHAFGLLDLLPAQLFGAVFVLAVGSALVGGAGLIASVTAFATQPHRERMKQRQLSARQEIREKQRAAENARFYANTLRSLDGLSPDERAIVRDCLAHDSSTFVTHETNHAVWSLRSKGLLVGVEGIHMDGEFPFVFHPFVWDALKARRAEFGA